MSKKIIYELRDMFDKQKGTQGNKKNITKKTRIQKKVLWNTRAHKTHCTHTQNFSIKRFFRITTKSAVLCGFGDIYWTNLSWKTFFN